MSPIEDRTGSANQMRVCRELLRTASARESIKPTEADSSKTARLNQQVRGGFFCATVTSSSKEKSAPSDRPASSKNFGFKRAAQIERTGMNEQPPGSYQTPIRRQDPTESTTKAHSIPGTNCWLIQP